MRAKQFPKLTMILVTWKDATSIAKWCSADELNKVEATTVRTMGFFMASKKQTLKIAHSVTSDGDSDYTCIPWGCIVKVNELSEI